MKIAPALQLVCWLHLFSQTSKCTFFSCLLQAPAAEAFRKNNPDAATFCANCNVILRAAMDKAGLADDCNACDEAVEQAKGLPADILAQLPAPGEVEFIMGGPPCQGYSGA